MRILLVEDEVLFARAVARHLRNKGHECALAGTLRDAKRALIGERLEPELMLLDVRLPDGNGLDLLSEQQQDFKADIPPTIVLTAFGDVDDAVTAMKLGAVDYVRKPVDLEELLLTVQRFGAGTALRRGFGRRRAAESDRRQDAILIGDSAPIRRARERIMAIARLCSTHRDAAPPIVLILGETGTGKDVAARLIHGCGDRSAERFVHVDCASLPRDLVEAELFGHARGAFTGAQQQRAGLIEIAGGGTVFLDEIGELPLPLQAKLLNVLERRRMRRIGSTQEIAVRARFMAATSRDLKRMVADGTFRADLFYRLNALSITMPPLRDCRQDLPTLAGEFARQTARQYGRPEPALGADAIDKLDGYAWPGNVRELRHVIEKAVLLARGPTIDADSLDIQPLVDIDTRDEDIDLGDLSLDEAERRLIENALRESDGNISQAARRLKVSRMKLRYRMRKHSVIGEGFRRG